MCRCNGETVDHLLLHYTVVSDQLSFASRSFEILGSNGQIPEKGIYLLFGWRDWLVSIHWTSGIQSHYVCCGQYGGNEILVRWRIQKTRTQLLSLFSGALYDWSRAWGFTHTSSLPEFIVIVSWYINLFLLYSFDSFVSIVHGVVFLQLNLSYQKKGFEGGGRDLIGESSSLDLGKHHNLNKTKCFDTESVNVG